MYLVVSFFHSGSKSSSAGIWLRTGLDWDGPFHLLHLRSQKAEGASGGSGVRHSFPNRELEDEGSVSMGGWEDRSQPGPGSQELEEGLRAS